MDDGDRTRALMTASVAPVASDLESRRPSSVSSHVPGASSIPAIAASECELGDPTMIGDRHSTVTETGFQLFRSAIEEFDESTLGALRGPYEPLAAASGITESETAAEAQTGDTRPNGMFSTTQSDEIDQRVHQFVASIAGFYEQGDLVGELKSSIEDHENHAQIVMPPS